MVKWTAKLPTLIVSVALFVAALLVENSKWRYAALVAALLFIGSGGFLYWSLSIKDWCSVVNQQSEFGGGFSSEFSGCLRLKGWFEF
jgi:hypothetical protein